MYGSGNLTATIYFFKTDFDINNLKNKMEKKFQIW